MNDMQKMLGIIIKNPGLRQSQIEERLSIPLKRIEEAIWALWINGKIQIDPNSMLRVTCSDEKVFRYDE